MGHAVHLQWRLHDRIARQSPKLGEIVAFRNVVPSIPLDTAVDELSIQGLVAHLGYRLVYEPDAVVYNRGPTTVGDFLRQRRRIYAGHLRIRDQQDYSGLDDERLARSSERSADRARSPLHGRPRGASARSPSSSSPARLGTTTCCGAGSSTSGRYRPRPSETSRKGRAGRGTERPRLPHRQLSTAAARARCPCEPPVDAAGHRSDQADSRLQGDRLDPAERDHRRRPARRSRARGANSPSDRATA